MFKIKELKTMYKQASIQYDTGRTQAEEYVHAVNESVRLGSDISDAYDHDTYVKCSKAMSIHGNVAEPSIDTFLGLILTVTISIFLISRYGGI